MPQPIKIAWDRIRVLVAHYFFGLFAKSFNGATVALDGFLGLAAGAAISETVTKPNWQVAAAIFGTAFIRNALAYFKEHPVPERLPEATQPPFSITLK